MNPRSFNEAIALEERKASKVAQLFALLRDPDLADTAIVRALTNGGSSLPLGTPKDQPGIRDAIRGLYKLLPTQFTSHDIIQRLRQNGYDFEARDAKSAIRDQLYALCQPSLRELKVVKRGKGGKSNIYEIISSHEET